jgi:EmrB/QacA subfamily drug resistance transporter
MSPGPEATLEPRSVDPRVVLGAVMLGTFLAPLDASIVNIALPSLSSDLSVSLAAVGWVSTVYLLTVSTLVLTMGRLADLWGLRRVYVAGFALFGLGSLACALSHAFGLLIAARAFQALGASMMFAAGPAIITTVVPPQRRGYALGMVGLAVSFGLSVGPPLGGLLVGSFGWPSIFWVNVPLSAVAAVIAWRVIPDDRPAYEPFDIAGALLGGGALLATLLALSATENWPIVSLPVAGTALLAVALWVVFIRAERAETHPMLDLSLFSRRAFASGSLAAMLCYTALFSLIFLMPFYLTSARGMDVRAAGLVLVTTPVVTALLGPMFGRLSDRRGTRTFTTGGLALMALGLAGMSLLRTTTPLPLVMLGLLVTGAGSAMFQSPNSSAILGATPRERLGVGSAVVSEARNVGMALGIALTAALASAGLPKGGSAAHMAQTESALFMSSMSRAVLVAAAIAAVGSAVSWTRGGDTVAPQTGTGTGHGHLDGEPHGRQ